MLYNNVSCQEILQVGVNWTFIGKLSHIYDTCILHAARIYDDETKRKMLFLKKSQNIKFKKDKKLDFKIKVA